MRLCVLLGCVVALAGSVRAADQITVAAAADLNYAFTEMAARFEKATGTKVVVSVGSSGNLFSQIEKGAPFDLFFSADEEYPKKLAAAGVVDGATVRTYAIGHLVLWVPNSVALDPAALKMELLTHPSIAHIALANPQHAPYGRAAMAALEHYGLKEATSGKLVFGESVSQAAQFAQSGNAQAGLIALSLAESPAMASAGKYWEVPVDAYPELRQAAGVVTASKNKKSAQAFLDFVLCAEGQVILQTFGLTPVPKP